MILQLIMQKCYVHVILALLCSLKAQETTGVSTTPAPQVEYVFLEDDNNRTWTTLDPYPTVNQDLIIKTDYGFSVQITIEYLDIDSKDGDFFVIKSGTKLEDEGKGKVFIYHLKSKREYLVHSNNVYVSLQVHGKNENGKRGVSIVYRRFGKQVVTTTTDKPTTVVTWPTPVGTDSIYHTVYISGKTEEDFRDNQTLLMFKTALAEMATEYCTTNDFVLSENITEQNVQIYHLTRCSYTWPESETCMKIRYALPVVLHESSPWTGYQLTTDHLEQMWTHLASSYLQKYEMDVYSVPDNKSSLTKWIVISSIVVILFLILLYFVKVVGRHFSPSNNGKRRVSDTAGFVTTDKKTSNASLAPHPYQSTPAFFDNDYSFDKFDIDLGLPKHTTYTDYSYPLSEEESDIEIFENFSNSRHNTQQTETNS